MKLSRPQLACLTLLLMAPLAFAQAPATKAPEAKAKTPDPVAKIAATLEPSKKLVYKTVGDRKLSMHVFEPAGWKASDKRPCFLTIHGGGWAGGEPRRMYPFADHFAKLGMVGVSLEYRLINKQAGNTPFECVKDGRSAVRYLKSHAAELGIDPNKIIVSGGSAGGHVAAATALFTGIDESSDDANVTSTPAALVLLYPVIDTSKAGYGNTKCGEKWETISPVHQVRKDLPPTITFHGTSDTVTPFAGALAFDAAMRKAGNRSELVVAKDGKHGYLMFEETLYRDTLSRTEQFLKSLALLD
ncbi:Carboxylesterase NlhH [Anatilimnocola aggregata]|uniref:Carboxylesterase NlhH n=1 Tax=Anatilimnocola aggregata TaxID=2528021 RepID=A0A517Y551_9BACT|nr:alpha/beta hydrolase [Anatilimnocola aggregata]QDU25368.1 Carboxylesterase NlhH [Anatilimnocola aggregata]